MNLSPAAPEAARVDMFRAMVLVRAFENALVRERCLGRVPDLPPLSAGREPVAAGVCAHLRGGDVLAAAHRPHHLAIAHGMNLYRPAAESLSEHLSDRPLPGRGGGRRRWHLYDPDTDFVSPATAAEAYPLALGRAFRFQQEGSGLVAVSVTGMDEARHEGFREALSLAVLWSLPLVFVVEDADWGGEEPRSVVSTGFRPASCSYGMPATRVENNAVESVYQAAGTAIERARRGGGPSVIEVHTVSLTAPAPPHGFDAGAGRDPLPTYEEALRDHGRLDDVQVRRIWEEAQARVEEAIQAVTPPSVPEAHTAGAPKHGHRCRAGS